MADWICEQHILIFFHFNFLIPLASVIFVMFRNLYVYNLFLIVIVSCPRPDMIFMNAEFYSPRFVWPVGPSSSGSHQLSYKCCCYDDFSRPGVRCCFWLNLSFDLTLHKSCLNFWLKSEIRLKSETAPHPRSVLYFIMEQDMETLWR